MTGAAESGTDYLVVGAGAMGMAFTDVLLAETEATVTIVDRHAQPGGHWNDAYPFVRLHQPSSFYGVNSRPLGEDTVDETGWNRGLYELASGAEVVAYFDQVMNRQFLPSGRVRYLPMCRYEGEGRARSLVSGERFDVGDHHKTVDATYMNVTVPSTTPPSYEIAPGCRCVPPNGLIGLADLAGSVPVERYVVIGAGKTGIDACLWLLAMGVEPDHITWIMPRDSWLLDRANLQPGPEFIDETLEAATRQMEIGAEADSVDALFAGLEAEGLLLRLDPAVRPTMYRCATVTRAELEQLRRIRDVVRLGRVRRIEQDRLLLDDGEVLTVEGTLYVDCTADGLARRPVVPVFAGDRLTLQTVRTCQQVFSAAFIGHIEAAYGHLDDAARNELCTVVPHPENELDWLRTTIATTLNGGRWRADPDLDRWLGAARLDGFSQARSGDGLAPSRLEILARLRQSVPAAVTNLTRLLETAEQS